MGTARAEAKALSSLVAARWPVWLEHSNTQNVGRKQELRSESRAARPRGLGDQREDLGFYCETEGKLLRVQSR